MSFWSLEVFDELPSTSDYCIEQAKSGAPAGLAVMARQQSAGRGSRGRTWTAPEKNLNLSVLLRPACAASQAGLFSLMAGVSVAEALPVQTMLKWPNDILAGGAKLAGILIDAAPRDQHLEWLVIGIGINLANAPAIPGRATTALQFHGVAMAPDDAATAVLEALSRWHQAKPQQIIAAWLSRAHPVGTKLTINGSKTGHFAGLTEAGELRLATGSRIEIFNTGEVMLAHSNGEG